MYDSIGVHEEESTSQKAHASTQTPSVSFTTRTTEHERACDYLDLLVLRGEHIPDEFVCPITTFSMRDPVLAVDGFTYERKAIETWLKRASASPMTSPHGRVREQER